MVVGGVMPGCGDDRNFVLSASGAILTPCAINALIHSIEKWCVANIFTSRCFAVLASTILKSS